MCVVISQEPPPQEVILPWDDQEPTSKIPCATDSSSPDAKIVKYTSHPESTDPYGM